MSELESLFGEGPTLWMDAGPGLGAFFEGLQVGPAPSAFLPRSAGELAMGRQLAERMIGQAARALYPPAPDRGRRLTIPGPAGGLPLLLVLPAAAPRGAMLHIHGGGWWCGGPGLHLEQLAHWADSLGIAVASVDYRLAPEHPYPAAPDDCEAAALWWIEHCRREFGTGNILIGGESAGAHLALATLLRVRRRSGFRFAGGKFTYGLYDFGNGLPSRGIADGRKLMQDSALCAYYAEVFVPDAARRREPDVSPLYAVLDSDLPPALFAAGTLDPFLDDSLLMHARWQAGGNRSWLAVYREACHGFDMFPAEAGAHLRRLELAFMRHCLAANA
jgi:acetyl esterase/lipase